MTNRCPRLARFQQKSFTGANNPVREPMTCPALARSDVKWSPQRPCVSLASASGNFSRNKAGLPSRTHQAQSTFTAWLRLSPHDFVYLTYSIRIMARVAPQRVNTTIRRDLEEITHYFISWAASLLRNRDITAIIDAFCLHLHTPRKTYFDRSARYPFRYQDCIGLERPSHSLTRSPMPGLSLHN